MDSSVKTNSWKGRPHKQVYYKIFPIKDVTGKTPVISEYLDFGFYDQVS